MEFFDDLKIVWKFLAKYKREVYVIFGVAIFASMIEAMVPYIYGKIIDLIIKGETISIFLLILFVWLILSLIKDWGHRYVAREGEIISVRCANDLVIDFNRHVLYLGLSFHKSQKTGKLASKYIKASDYLQSIINEILFLFGSDLLTVFLAYLVILSIEWRIAFFLGIVIFIYLYITIKNIDKISKLLVKVIKLFEDAGGVAHDSVTNIQVVKANTNEWYEDKKVKNIFDDVQKQFNNFIGAWSKLDSYGQTIISASTVLMFGMLILLERNDAISIGQVVSIIGYSGLIFVPLRRISHNIERFKNSISIVKEALKLLDEPIEPYDKARAIVLDKIKGQIEFKDVDFNYGKNNPVLADINFKVKSGQVIALVGESGVGKSTLVDLISRYNIPASGKILFDGIDIQELDLKFLRSRIAVVPQEISLFNDTLKNNIIYGKLDATDAQIWRAAEAAHADEFINHFPDKLEQQVGERGVKLSTGQKQRVAIARAILKNPKILILDEATSALDSKSELLVQRALKRLIKGRTTFVIAHRLSTIQHADKILVLDKGRIIESGKHSALIKKKGLYYKLFSLQSLGEIEEE
ncbi:ABC transporter ATP-binding protein/permease [Patescibacteria group bacterium]|nr:ABC transporter ATP-binding protein/permease [Patescibacteria group bacterium]MBU4579628.1 ABC transporter ATP-binding protein/permease [Patescibacteria group bacterium]